jgi:hypothetical protein
MSMLAWERAVAAYQRAPNGVTFRSSRNDRVLEIALHVPASPMLVRYTIEHLNRELRCTWNIRVIANPDADGMPTDMHRHLAVLEEAWSHFLTEYPTLMGAKAWRCPVKQQEFQ